MNANVFCLPTGLPMTTLTIEINNENIPIDALERKGKKMNRVLRLQTLASYATSKEIQGGGDSTISAGLCSSISGGLCSSVSAGLCEADS